MPVWAYADLQVLGQAIAATKSLNDDTLAAYMRQATFQTVVGEVKFGPLGEWTQKRTLAAQFQNIKGNSIDDFPGTGARSELVRRVIWPPQTGTLSSARHSRAAVTTGDSIFSRLGGAPLRTTA
jgi:hypothetical protein